MQQGYLVPFLKCIFHPFINSFIKNLHGSEKKVSKRYALKPKGSETEIISST
jgi:hypothetical protein